VSTLISRGRYVIDCRVDAVLLDLTGKPFLGKRNFVRMNRVSRSPVLDLYFKIEVKVRKFANQTLIVKIVLHGKIKNPSVVTIRRIRVEGRVKRKGHVTFDWLFLLYGPMRTAFGISPSEVGAVNAPHRVYLGCRDPIATRPFGATVRAISYAFGDICSKRDILNGVLNKWCVSEPVSLQLDQQDGFWTDYMMNINHCFGAVSVALEIYQVNRYQNYLKQELEA
jgi:hypothetical protein